MNNKGMTLVELIITFSLLMIIVIGMFNLILDAKVDLDNKRIIKNETEFSDFINNDIHYDLIKRQPFAIAIKQSSTSNWTCTYSNRYEYQNNCSVANSVFSVNVSKNADDEDVALHINGSKSLSNICNDFYPCAVYAYYNTASGTTGNHEASFQVIAFNNDLNKNGGKIAVKYGNVIENIPEQKYVNTSKTVSTINLKKGLFEIEYPIYLTDNDNNYGFRIVYPFLDIEKPDSDDNADDISNG